MKLSVKAKRNIGLIVLTVAVVVAIILVVYFVQKNDEDNKLKTGAIGQVVSTSRADICVKDMQILQSVNGLTTKEGKCYLQVSLDIKANKKITVSSDKFEVKDGKNVTNERRVYDEISGEVLTAISCESEIILKKGESKSYKLLYEVDAGRIESYFLFAYGARIDLGGTILN